MVNDLLGVAQPAGWPGTVLVVGGVEDAELVMEAARVQLQQAVLSVDVHAAGCVFDYGGVLVAHFGSGGSLVHVSPSGECSGAG